MIKNNNFTAQGFVVWGICAVFFLYEFLLRTVLGTFQSPIMQDLQITTLKFSILSSTMYLLIYGLMQVPVGLIVDGFGLKKSLTFAALVCAASSFGFAISQDYTTALIFRLLTGFGSSFGFICLLYAVYDWMPHRHSGLLIGLSQFIGTLGPMLAAGPLDALAENLTGGWRLIFNILGAFGLGLTILIFFLVKDKQQKGEKYLILQRPSTIKDNVLSLFKRRRPWFIGLFSALSYFAIEYLSENEGKSIIMLKGYAANSASYMLTLSWLGYAIGCPLLGFVSDFFQRRRPVMIFSGVSCALSIAAIAFCSQQIYLLLAFFFLGIGASGQSIGFAIIAEQFKKRTIAIGLSLNNAMVTTFASINAPLIGFLIDYVKEGGIAQLPHYNIVFAILISMGGLSIIFPLFLVRETYCKSVVDFTYLKKKFNPIKL